MEVVYDDESMADYMRAAVGVTPDRPILIDRFLNHALECEADAVSGAFGYRHTGDILAVKNYAASSGIDNAGDHSCKCGLAASVGTCDSCKSVFDGKIYVIEDYLALWCDIRQISDFKHLHLSSFISIL